MPSASLLDSKLIRVQLLGGQRQWFGVYVCVCMYLETSFLPVGHVLTTALQNAHKATTLMRKIGLGVMCSYIYLFVFDVVSIFPKNRTFSSNRFTLGSI